MNKRILAALLAVVLLLFALSSCEIPTFISNLLPKQTEEVTTPEPPELPTPGEDSYFEAHFIDVGQADSALIICDGQAMLIDAGNVADTDLVQDYLEEYNVTHLNYVIGTHPHEDHIGGLKGVLRHTTADKIYCSAKTYSTKAFRDFANYVGYNLKKELIIPTPGESFLLGSARVTVLGPLRLDYEDVNDTSIVLRIEYGDLTFLFTGDMESVAERDLLDAETNLKADVLKVGHHGSYSSSSYRFLREVAPTYGVISCGRNNDYGHPHESVLSRYRDADVKLYRTDLQGHIVCRTTDGKTLTFTTQMNPDAVTNPTAVQSDTSYLPTYLYYEEKFN